jgi:CRISPR-associated protein Cas1
MPQDLHELPKLRDSLSYVFVEHAIIERKDSAIEFINKEGRVLVPIASTCVLLLGPGTSITHAAVRALAENGCSIVWTATEGNQCYGQGTGETRKAFHLLHQAEMVCDPEKHTQVVLNMYRKRFGVDLDPGLSLPQIRGMEGVRVRNTYREASEQYGVPWEGRNYDRKHWDMGNPINRAISASHALLNGLCHAAIVSGGYSPALGFVHVGRQLSFVYDIADLYKTELTIPLAFQIVAASPDHVDSRAREACREKFHQAKLLERILPDIDELLAMDETLFLSSATDQDPSMPEPLWEKLFDSVEERAAWLS